MTYSQLATVIAEYAVELQMKHMAAKTYQEKSDIMRKIEALEELSDRLLKLVIGDLSEKTAYNEWLKKA